MDDRRGVLVRAVEVALECRGTVMVEVRGNKRQWCAACASVRGDLELRVGEPRRGWRRWRRTAGEEWLVDHGFVPVVDAWARPLDWRAGPAQCAAILDAALENGLGVDRSSFLDQTLVHPGVAEGVNKPPADADDGDHIAAALIGVARAGRGAASVETGRPARYVAAMFAADGALIIETPVADGPSADRELGRFALSEDGAVEAAKVLATEIRDEPLFIGLMHLDP